MEHSKASGAEKQRGQLRPGEREEEGRIPHCPFQREKGQSPEWKRQAGQETPPGSICPRRAEDTCTQHKFPPCCTKHGLQHLARI